MEIRQKDHAKKPKLHTWCFVCEKACVKTKSNANKCEFCSNNQAKARTRRLEFASWKTKSPAAKLSCFEAARTNGTVIQECLHSQDWRLPTKKEAGADPNVKKAIWYCIKHCAEYKSRKAAVSDLRVAPKPPKYVAPTASTKKTKKTKKKKP